MLRLSTGVVPVGVAMEAKKGCEVCVRARVCAETHMHVGVWERKSDEWACA